MALTLAGATLASGAIGAGASLAGGFMSSSKSSKSARRLLQMQINWERERAKNAHQWEMADLKAAGLNPALTATGGSGASTSGVSGAMPDTSSLNAGFTNAGNILANSAKNIAEIKAIDSQTGLNSATKGKVEQETAQKVIENSNLDKSIKTDIKQKEANIAKMKIDTRYQEESFNHRLTQQMAETEKSVAEGRISINAAKFLEKYGITRQEALTLGVEGMRIIFGGIKQGLSNMQIHKQAKEMLKLKQIVRNSAKKR